MARAARTGEAVRGQANAGQDERATDFLRRGPRTALAPLWWTPHSLLRPAYGFHGFITVVANCYLAAGLMFLAYMGWRAYQAVNPQRRRVPFVELSREAG